MCIICYKPENKKMPKYEVLKTMFENNPDGSGFMYCHNGRVYGEKGFMNFDSFYKALKVHQTIWKKSPFVLHFRISTQAGVNRECTHPFPLSDNMEDLKKLEFNNRIGITHNGIISLTTSYSKKITHSDTMEFITDYLSLIIQNTDYWKNNNTVTLIERLVESKLAILDDTGHCELIGDFQQVNGIYYSNDSYKKRTYKYTTCSHNKKLDKCYADYMEVDASTEEYYDMGYMDYEDDYGNIYSCPALAYDNYEMCEKCYNNDICWG